MALVLQRPLRALSRVLNTSGELKPIRQAPQLFTVHSSAQGAEMPEEATPSQDSSVLGDSM